MLESLLPVWVNLLFVLIAQTIIWVFFISGLFAKSANEVIRAINRCIKMGRYTAPVSDDKIASYVPKINSIDMAKAIQPIPGPTIKGNKSSIQKLGICILVSFVVLVVMTVLARSDARHNVLWYFLLASIAYLFEVFFLAWVVVPYKHIGDVEVVYEATDTTRMPFISNHSLAPKEEIIESLNIPPITI